jgi:hypothetical protein
VLANFGAHGLDVNQLRDVLSGGVFSLTARISKTLAIPEGDSTLLVQSPSHDDKVAYPDLGIRGSLAREKLHGRTATGTWVQLEKTPAAFG